jgi:hypothetical protein
MSLLLLGLSFDGYEAILGHQPLNDNPNGISDLNNLGKDLSHAYGMLFILAVVYWPFSSTDSGF